MPDTAFDFESSLGNMSKTAWISKVTTLVGNRGYVTPLGARHTATFVKDSATLLVSFETHQGIQTLSPDMHPLGWNMVKTHGWSHLGIISDGDTWFRDSAVYAFFDGRIDDGFFDAFETVVFYGAGPCGYAAAAFSVAAPGARVLAIQPQATLDPRVTEWDKRFIKMRRTDFTRRYGYAPDMLDAAAETFVIYDPLETEDAMHAALYTRPGVTKLRLPHMGAGLQTDLLQLDIVFPMIIAAGKGTLTPASFARLARARRDHLPYLRKLLARLEHDDRPARIAALRHNVIQRICTPRRANRLEPTKDRVPD